MNLLFVGDVMPGGVLHYQDCFISKELIDYMHQFKLRIGTLECAVGNNIPVDENKQRVIKPVVYVHNEDLIKVVELGLNAVSLANNHVFDLGIDGFLNTIKQLDSIGVKWFGAGRNFEEAKKPYVVDLEDGEQLAIMGCLFDYPKPVIFYPPTDNDTPCLNYQSIDGICRDIKEAKSKYKNVIVMPHWGLEHIYLQPKYFKDVAYKMIEAGADLIVGGHPHIINPITTYNGKKILFSLGNFLFADRCVAFPRWMYYPSEEEKKRLERYWAHPYPTKRKEPFICVWPGMNRIGMIAAIDIKRRMKFSYRLVVLDKNNILKEYSSGLVRCRLFVLGCLIKLPCYHIVLRVFNTKKNKLTIWLNGRKAFNYPIEL